MKFTAAYLDGKVLKAAIVSKDDKNNIKIEKTFYIKNANNIKNIVTGLDGDETLIRNYKTSLKNKKKLIDVINFQLDDLFPLNKKAILIPIFYKKQNETLINIFACNNFCIKKHLNLYKSYNINPIWTSSTVKALQRFAKYFYPEKTDLIIFNIGNVKTTIVSIFDDIITAYLVINSNSTQLKKDLYRALVFFKEKNQKKLPKEILFLGNSDSNLKNIATSSVLDLKEIKNNDNVSNFAIEIGLCLDILNKDDNKSVQFRQGSYVNRNQLFKVKEKIFICAVSAIILTISMFLTSNKLIKKNESYLNNKITEIVSCCKNEIPLKNFKKDEKNISKKIELLKEDINNIKKPYNYYLKTPLVSNFLSYLNKNKLNDEINIKKICYNLESYPKINSPFENYSIKINLIFTTKDSKTAKEFYNIISKDTNFIDNKQKIEFETNENEYKMVFNIKNKNY